MTPRERVAAGALLVSLVAVTAARCNREQRPFAALPNTSQVPPPSAETSLQAGPSTGAPPSHGSPYQGNAWAISEGKRLYNAYNCSGCHAHGGGAIGPALMDEDWIYGFEPDDIYRTIVDGRPNGMPTFRGRIPDYQVWQLVSYVQAMSGQVPVDAAPGRDDHLSSRVPETISAYQGRRQTGHR